MERCLPIAYFFCMFTSPAPSLLPSLSDFFSSSESFCLSLSQRERKGKIKDKAERWCFKKQAVRRERRQEKMQTDVLWEGQ